MRAAVLGSPIAHSLSPVIHRAGYLAAGLTGWEYTAHEVDADALPGFVGGLDTSWRGLSLTMPLQAVAGALATTVDAVATRSGAVNTLVRRADGGWDATNTDVVGVIEALRPIQARHAELMADIGELDQVLAEGAARAREISQPKVDEMKHIMGLVAASVHPTSESGMPLQDRL